MVFKLIFLSNYWVTDKFQTTPPIATFSLALVISELKFINHNVSDSEGDHKKQLFFLEKH